VFVAGPLAGAIIAVGCAVVLRGPGGDPAARVVASGRLVPTLGLGASADVGTGGAGAALRFESLRVW
jgi:hypothetical protein